MMCCQAEADTHFQLHGANSQCFYNSLVTVIGYGSMYALHNNQNYHKYECL